MGGRGEKLKPEENSERDKWGTKEMEEEVDGIS